MTCHTWSPNGYVVSDLKYTYDLAGRVLTTTDGDNNVTTNTYNAAGQVVTTTAKDNGGRVVSSRTNTYDGNGNRLTATDALGNVTTNTYDGNGNVLTSRLTDSGGRVITSQTNTYDPAGLLATTTDGAGDVTLNVYEGGRKVSTTVGYGTAAASTVVYAFDANGNVSSETDALGNKTSYTYDANGNVLTTTTPLGTTVNTYDLAGNLLTKTDPLGRKVVNSYDGGRLMSATWYNADGSTANVLSYTYDGNGNMLTATDSAGTVTMTYDGNRLATRTDPFGVTLTYGYDLAGNVVSIADSLGGTTTKTYEGNELVSLRYQDAASQLRADFLYDGAGELSTITRYADVAGTQRVGATQYAYDGGQLTSITSQDGSGNQLQSDVYAYDAASRLASQTYDGVQTLYAYDATGQLTADGAKAYTYDANGNRTIAGYHTGTDNELTTDGTWNYAYDLMGNTVQKVNVATGETWTYSYDLNNRLLSAVDKQANGTLIQQANYGYDALGDRIQESATSGGSTTVTDFAFDAAGNVWADLDGTHGNALETRRLFLQGADEVFARIAASGNAAWYLTDHEGTVQDVVSEAGAVLDHRAYDAFGNITAETNAAQGDRYGEAGGELDPVTGEVKYGVRDVFTTIGRFSTVDPSGLRPDSNLFRLDGNGPTDGTDPSGLHEIIHIPFWDSTTGEQKELLRFRWSGPFRTTDSYLGIYDPKTEKVSRTLSDGTVYTVDIAAVNASTNRFSAPKDSWFSWYGTAVETTPIEQRVTASDATARQQMGAASRETIQETTPVMKGMAMAPAIPFAAANPGGATMTAGQAAVRGAAVGVAAGLTIQWVQSKAPSRSVHIVPGVSATIGEDLSEEDAIAVVRAGGDVIAQDEATARRIAAAAGDGTVDHDDAHRPGERPHFHPKQGGNRVGGHVLY